MSHVTVVPAFGKQGIIGDCTPGIDKLLPPRLGPEDGPGSPVFFPEDGPGHNPPVFC